MGSRERLEGFCKAWFDRLRSYFSRARVRLRQSGPIFIMIRTGPRIYSQFMWVRNQDALRPDGRQSQVATAGGTKSTDGLIYLVFFVPGLLAASRSVSIADSLYELGFTPSSIISGFRRLHDPDSAS